MEKKQQMKWKSKKRSLNEGSERKGSQKKKENGTQLSVPSTTESKVHVANFTTTSSSCTRKRAQRANQCLPRSPKGWTNYTPPPKNATPKQKSMVSKLQIEQLSSFIITTTTTITIQLHWHGHWGEQSGSSIESLEDIKKRWCFSPDAPKVLNMDRYTLNRSKKRKVKRLTSKPKLFKEQWQPKVNQFLEEKSRIMPNKKDTVIINGKCVAKRRLLTTKYEAYQNFIKVHPSYNKTLWLSANLYPKTSEN